MARKRGKNRKPVTGIFKIWQDYAGKGANVALVMALLAALAIVIMLNAGPESEDLAEYAVPMPEPQPEATIDKTPAQIAKAPETIDDLIALGGPVDIVKQDPIQEARAQTDKLPAKAIKPRDGIAPRIAIVLDDMGLNEKAAARAARLPGPLTFAFMPYAKGLPAQTRAAQQRGHELLVHMPMEPVAKSTDPGPNALITGLDSEELTRRLQSNLSQFDGYVGFNNHMGSRFTGDEKAMRVVLQVAKERGLLFLDSRTTERTVAPRLARELDVPFVARDVFLDNVRSDAAIRKQLDVLVRAARKHGSAIAIGHPYPETLSVLADWLPGLADEGITLVPLSSLVEARGNS